MIVLLQELEISACLTYQYPLTCEYYLLAVLFRWLQYSGSCRSYYKCPGCMLQHNLWQRVPSGYERNTRKI